LEGVSGRKKK